VKVILTQVVLEVTRDTAGESRFSGDGQKKLLAGHKDVPGHRRVVKDKPGQGRH
jgi:hypothetical protein